MVGFEYYFQFQPTKIRSLPENSDICGRDERESPRYPRPVRDRDGGAGAGGTGGRAVDNLQPGHGAAVVSGLRAEPADPGPVGRDLHPAGQHFLHAAPDGPAAQGLQGEVPDAGRGIRPVRLPDRRVDVGAGLAAARGLRGAACPDGARRRRDRPGRQPRSGGQCLDALGRDDGRGLLAGAPQGLLPREDRDGFAGRGGLGRPGLAVLLQSFRIRCMDRAGRCPAGPYAGGRHRPGHAPAGGPPRIDDEPHRPAGRPPGQGHIRQKRS